MQTVICSSWPSVRLSLSLTICTAGTASTPKASVYFLFTFGAGIMGSKLTDVTDCNQLLPLNLRPCRESQFASLKCLSVSLME